MSLLSIPNRHDCCFLTVILATSVGLWFTNIHLNTTSPQSGSKEKARVLTVDNSGIEQIGLLTQGTQRLRVLILSGASAGKEFTADNQLRAQMELDKIFSPGDVILVGIYEGADPAVSTINAQDYYRTGWTITLFLLFAALLLLFGGFTGLTALLSFVFSCLLIWKVLVPFCLRGYNPMILSLGTVTLLSAIIIFLIAGFTRKGTTAFLGAIAGVLVSCFLGWLFSRLFHINGAAMPFSQALLYNGYESMNLSQIYIGGIFIGSSGAVMDLGMDISAGMTEVVRQNPEISRNELILSGIRIGQSVVGTMTTTLLLAYSGGYLTLLMMFAAQGTSPVDFFNNPYVSCEVVKTIVGSFGLVLVAPLTALIGGYLLNRNDKQSV